MHGAIVGNRSLRLNAAVAWGTVAAMLVVDVVWMAAAGWTADLRAVALAALLIATFSSPLVFRRYRSDARLRDALPAISLTLAFVPVCAAFSYLVVATNFELVDGPLAAMDVALGLDWRAWNAWVNSRPLLRQILSVAYNSGFAQIAFIVIGLGLWQRTERVYEFLAIYFVAAALCVLISGLYPVAGPWKFYGEGRPEDLAMLTHFEQLRSGRSFVMFHELGQGLVSMPSFHAMSGLFFVYAVRGLRWVFPAAVALNLLLVLSTPTVGGHYFVDVIAGLALGVLLIHAWRRLHLPFAGATAAGAFAAPDTSGRVAPPSRV